VVSSSGRVARGRLTAATVAALALTPLSGCGGDTASPADAEPTPKATVVFADDAYVPATVRVAPGSRVTFFNGSATANTAETDGVGFFEFDREKLDRQNLFDIHTLQPGEAESVELDTPGTYRYGSSLDDEMKGVIEVVEPPG
jgi:plastocyanin